MENISSKETEQASFAQVKQIQIKIQDQIPKLQKPKPSNLYPMYQDINQPNQDPNHDKGYVNYSTYNQKRTPSYKQAQPKRIINLNSEPKPPKQSYNLKQNMINEPSYFNISQRPEITYRKTVQQFPSQVNIQNKFDSSQIAQTQPNQINNNFYMFNVNVLPQSLNQIPIPSNIDHKMRENTVEPNITQQKINPQNTNNQSSNVNVYNEYKIQDIQGKSLQNWFQTQRESLNLSKEQENYYKTNNIPPYQQTKQFQKLTQRIERLRQKSANKLIRSSREANVKNQLQKIYRDDNEQMNPLNNIFENNTKLIDLRNSNSSYQIKRGVTSKDHSVRITKVLGNIGQEKTNKVFSNNSQQSQKHSPERRDQIDNQHEIDTDKVTEIHLQRQSSNIKNNQNIIRQIQMKNRKIISQKKKLLEDIYINESPKQTQKLVDDSKNLYKYNTARKSQSHTKQRPILQLINMKDNLEKKNLFDRKGKQGDRNQPVQKSLQKLFGQNHHYEQLGNIQPEQLIKLVDLDLQHQQQQILYHSQRNADKFSIQDTERQSDSKVVIIKENSHNYSNFKLNGLFDQDRLLENRILTKEQIKSNLSEIKEKILRKSQHDKFAPKNEDKALTSQVQKFDYENSPYRSTQSFFKKNSKTQRKSIQANNGLIYTSQNWRPSINKAQNSDEKSNSSIKPLFHDESNRQWKNEQSNIPSLLPTSHQQFQMIHKTNMFDNNNNTRALTNKIQKNINNSPQRQNNNPKFKSKGYNRPDKNQQQLLISQDVANHNNLSDPQDDLLDIISDNDINSDTINLEIQTFTNQNIENDNSDLQIQDLQQITQLEEQYNSDFNQNQKQHQNFINDQEDKLLQKSVESIKEKINNLHLNLQKFDNQVNQIKEIVQEGGYESNSTISKIDNQLDQSSSRIYSIIDD